MIVVVFGHDFGFLRDFLATVDGLVTREAGRGAWKGDSVTA